jgi:hypothetical protein
MGMLHLCDNDVTLARMAGKMATPKNESPARVPGFRSSRSDEEGRQAPSFFTRWVSRDTLREAVLAGTTPF